MIIYYIGIPLLMLAAVIDSSVLVQLRYLNGQPSLLLMMIVAWGLLNNLGDGLVWAVIGGIFADLMSTAPTGTSSLGYSIALMVLAATMGQVGRRNIVLPFVAGAIATIILQTVTFGILLFSGSALPIRPVITTWIIPSMVFNAIGIIIVFRIMGGIIEFFRPPKVTL